MIDLVNPVDRLTRSGRKGNCNGSGGKTGKDRERRLGGVIRRYSLLMCSEGLCRVALIVALKYIRDWGGMALIRLQRSKGERGMLEENEGVLSDEMEMEAGQ